MTPSAFGILSGLWALGMLAVFISAIRLSYRVEARSEGLRNRSGLPRNAMIFHVVANSGVATDPDTQALRRRMLQRLAIVVIGFILFGLAIAFRAPA